MSILERIVPSPTGAALAGVFSAIVWPIAWARYGGPESGASVELVVATLLIIAFPAHVFVVGLRRTQAPGAGKLDTALLKRIAAWLAGAAATVAVSSLLG